MTQLGICHACCNKQCVDQEQQNDVVIEFGLLLAPNTRSNYSRNIEHHVPFHQVITILVGSS